MSISKLNKKGKRVAEIREMNYLRHSERVLKRQREALEQGMRKEEQRKQKSKIGHATDAGTVASTFAKLGRAKPKNRKALYFKTLSRNKILDLSDDTMDSQLSYLIKTLKARVISDYGQDPKLKARNVQSILNYIKDMDTDKQGMKSAFKAVRNDKARDGYDIKAKQLVEFVLGKHVEESYLFGKSMRESFSEADYVVKFWGPLIELIFKGSGVVPHWGDTQPETCNIEGIAMKMDLRLISVPPTKSRKNDDISIDAGSGEFARNVNASKYYRDKRKTVVASKACINAIVKKNKTLKHGDLYVPYIIVMGFEAHLCFVRLVEKKLYITKTFWSMAFPWAPANIEECTNGLIKGLLYLVEMALNLKDVIEDGDTKVKSMNALLGIGRYGGKQNEDLITQIVWDDDTFSSEDDDDGIFSSEDEDGDEEESTQDEDDE